MKRNASFEAPIVQFEIPPVSIDLGIGSSSKNRRRSHRFERLGKAAIKLIVICIAAVTVWISAGMVKELIFKKAAPNWVDAPLTLMADLAESISTKD